jgi:lipopolysaccharide export system protein LptA
MKILFALLGAAATATLLAADLTRPPSRPGMTVHADYQEIELRSNTVVYTGNVRVVDPPAKPGGESTMMLCDSLRVSFISNRIDWLVAEGAVQIDQDQIHARGGKAVYTSSNEQMVLTGAFKGAPVPKPYIFKPPTTNYGDVIIYNRLDGKVMFQRPVTETTAGVLSRETNAPGEKAPAPKNQKPTAK